MRIRKHDATEPRRSPTAWLISIGGGIEARDAAPEPLFAPLDRFATRTVSVDDVRSRWVQMSDLGPCGCSPNGAMRGA